MTYEIRPMSFGEILDMGFRIIRDSFMPLISIAAVIYVPIAVATDWFAHDPTGAMAIGVLAATGLAFLVASPIVSAAIIFAVGEAYLGRPVEFAKSFRSVMPIIFPLLGTTLLGALYVIGGYLLLIIPGVYLQLCYILAWQVMVLERVFGRRALSRSRALMRGNLLRGFGVLFIGALIIAVTSQMLQLVLGFIPFLGPVAAGLAQAAGAAYTSAITVVLYFDIRCRKEAFDLEHLARIVEAKGAMDTLVPSVP
jgi:hypothetical protein